MRTFFKKIFYPRKKLILSEILAANQDILEEIKLTLAELRGIHGDSRKGTVYVHDKITEMSKGIAGLTKMIYDMVESLSKYFKLEVEFMEKEKEKKDRKPTDHDHIF